MQKITIATRKSALAMWQAQHLAHLLHQAWPKLGISLAPMTTSGDTYLDAPLYKIGGKGLFLKELEQALLRKDADIAVHSAKDMPSELADGFSIVAALPRSDPRDAFVSPIANDFAQLPKNAIVGTSSLRRAIQICARWPHVQIKNIRGNVNTRLAKLDDGQYHALVLACAGLDRLGLAHRICQRIDTNEIFPAIGQGTIVVEAHNNNKNIQKLLAPITDTKAAITLACERAFGKHLHADCHTGVAGYARMLADGHIHLQAMTMKNNILATKKESSDLYHLDQHKPQKTTTDPLDTNSIKKLAKEIVRFEVQGKNLEHITANLAKTLHNYAS